MTQNDAIELLRRTVAGYGKGGMTRAAIELDYSKTLVSLVLNGTYHSPLDKIAARIIEVYGQISCPVLGSVSAIRCEDERKKPFGAQDIWLYRACRECMRKGEAA